MGLTYQEFLKTKIELATSSGFDVDPERINKALKPHQRDAVIWALKGGEGHSLRASVSVPYVAIKKGRRGYMCELNPDYFRDAIGYLQAAESEYNSPTLFDFIGQPA